MAQSHFPPVDPTSKSRQDEGLTPSKTLSSHLNSVCAALGKGNGGQGRGLPQNPAPSSPQAGHGDGAAPHPLPPGGNSSIFGINQTDLLPSKSAKGEK